VIRVLIIMCCCLIIVGCPFLPRKTDIEERRVHINEKSFEERVEIVETSQYIKEK